PTAVFFLLLANSLQAQTYRPPLPPPPTGPAPLSPDPNQLPGTTANSKKDPEARSNTQEVVGPLIKLRGDARITTSEILFTADEIDYNRDTEYLEARGHVHFEQLITGEKLDCDRVAYYLSDKNGKFYKVKGTSPSRIEARPGLLTTQNPFYFEGEWAER